MDVRELPITVLPPVTGPSLRMSMEEAERLRDALSELLARDDVKTIRLVTYGTA